MEEFIVGWISRAHGLEGELFVRPETDSPAELFVPGRILRVQKVRPGLSAQLTVTAARPHGSGWLMETEEVSDRSLAERYAGGCVLLPQEELPDLSANEYFLHELVGLLVVDEERGELGTVTEVYEAPSSPLLAVPIEEKEKLIPFTREVVVEVDLMRQRLRVRLPEGLLEV